MMDCGFLKVEAGNNMETAIKYVIGAWEKFCTQFQLKEVNRKQLNCMLSLTGCCANTFS